MAQVEVRAFNPSMPDGILDDLANALPKLAFKVHYPEDAVKQTKDSDLILNDGDITSVFYEINRSRSSSDADYEIEVSEGSDNWPRGENGELLGYDEMVAALNDRAERISQGLRDLFGGYSHNIFEVNGVATGWYQYPGAGRE
jgi:hypothetical protein